MLRRRRGARSARLGIPKSRRLHRLPQRLGIPKIAVLRESLARQSLSHYLPRLARPKIRRLARHPSPGSSKNPRLAQGPPPVNLSQIPPACPAFFPTTSTRLGQIPPACRPRRIPPACPALTTSPIKSRRLARLVPLPPPEKSAGLPSGSFSHYPRLAKIRRLARLGFPLPPPARAKNPRHSPLQNPAGLPGPTRRQIPPARPDRSASDYLSRPPRIPPACPPDPLPAARPLPESRRLARRIVRFPTTSAARPLPESRRLARLSHYLRRLPTKNPASFPLPPAQNPAGSPGATTSPLKIPGSPGTPPLSRIRRLARQSFPTRGSAPQNPAGLPGESFGFPPGSQIPPARPRFPLPPRSPKNPAGSPGGRSFSDYKSAGLPGGSFGFPLPPPARAPPRNPAGSPGGSFGFRLPHRLAQRNLLSRRRALTERLISQAAPAYNGPHWLDGPRCDCRRRWAFLSLHSRTRTILASEYFKEY